MKFKCVMKVWISSVLFVLLSACGSGGGGSNTAALSGDVVPANNSLINTTIPIVLSANKSLKISSLQISGTLSGQSDGGNWSTNVNVNDTLTFSPLTKWPVGQQTLQISATDESGVSLGTLNLSYTVDLMPTVLNIFPVGSTTINRDIPVVITFSESMDTATLVASGSLWDESNSGMWSTETVENDTLTISPSPLWSASAAPALSFGVNDLGGIPSVQINLSYTTTAFNAETGIYCTDGIDNDGNGAIDYDEPGCLIADGSSCPFGVACSSGYCNGSSVCAQIPNECTLADTRCNGTDVETCTAANPGTVWSISQSCTGGQVCGSTPPQCIASVCVDGDTRQCGSSNVGQCTFGTQACSGGVWGACTGETLPLTA